MMDIDTIRAETEAALREALGERPALLAEFEAAARQAHDAQRAFEIFQIRIARATRHGGDEASAVVLQLVDEERRTRDVAAAAGELARRQLANCDWRIGRHRGELEQLALVANPPSPDRAAVYEIVKRPQPPAPAGDFETIHFPKPAA
jgi:hypothetical protein